MYKIGDYILCKKNIYSFKRSHSYVISSKVPGDFEMLRIMDDYGNNLTFIYHKYSTLNITDYFYTPSETRKLKLLKIKNV